MSKGFSSLVIILFGLVFIIGVSVAYILGKNSSSLITKRETLAKHLLSISSPSASTLPQTSKKQIVSERCNITVEIPSNWEGKEARGEFSPNMMGCLYINAPDYNPNLDSYEGLQVGIYRTQKGITFKNVNINTLDDYIKAVEAIQEPTVYAKNVQDKKIGFYQGKYYEYEAYLNNSNFIFEKDNYIYNIQWLVNYTGKYKSEVENIISSFK